MRPSVRPETLRICLDLLNGVSVPVHLPDATDKMAALVAAREDILAELNTTKETA